MLFVAMLGSMFAMGKAMGLHDWTGFAINGVFAAYEIGYIAIVILRGKG
jgi:hypothetical protein